jgi:hypothetical protein
MAVHHLKTDPKPFQATYLGDKPYEIRFDDRGFEIGDTLTLEETKFTGEEMKAGKPLIYTGRYEGMVIHYILRGPICGLKEGWVILS